MKKIYKVSESELKKLYVNSKLSSRDIAKIYRRDKKTILNKLKKYNLPIRNSHIKLGFSRYSISKERLEELYNNKKLNIQEIAKILDCSQWSVCKRMKECGIKPRDRKKYISESVLKDLYYGNKISAKKIAELHGCSRPTVIKLIKSCGIKLRDHSEAVMLYEKNDFSNDKLEKAYMLGFRQGDLNVKKISKNGRTINVKCSSTKEEQINLFANLFSKYGHIYKCPRIYKGKKVTDLNAYLNNSFKFLLDKKDDIEKWILTDKDYFLAFLAGYMDAEGNIHISKRRKAETSIKIESYDKGILNKIYLKLNQTGINCPKPIDIIRKTHKKPLWRLRMSSHNSVIGLLEMLIYHLKHAKRRKDAEMALAHTKNFMKFCKQRGGKKNGLLQGNN